MAATTGDAWRAIYSERESMARQPPLSLTRSRRWQQQALTETFANHFPVEVFEGFNLPYIEDLVNLPAFTRYAEWAERRGSPLGCPSPPSHVEKTAARAARASDGVQLSAFSHKAALPPLVSFGLSPDEHFRNSMQIADGTLPSEKQHHGGRRSQVCSSTDGGRQDTAL